MKKFFSIMIGLSLLVGAASLTAYQGDKKDGDKKEEGKKKGKKKKDADKPPAAH